MSRHLNNVTIATAQGPRTYQEDRAHFQRIEKGDCDGWLLAVMDGHGGEAVSEYCRQRIGEYFMLSEASKAKTALSKLIARLARETENFRAGSTISIACILESHRKAVIAVLGDSPVIVLDGAGKLHASPEHNVRSNAKEREAAEKRGGIYMDGYIYSRHGDLGLQMSRALGDHNLHSVLSRDPEIYTIDDPRWVLVASDGVVDPGHANTDVLIRELEVQAKRGSDADSIIRWTSNRGLHDNATAVAWRR
ncbi:MAG: PP2C family serine/threonine-protein phosphatase [bacterium]|nr:PP2C family serine/threonine-protein phosphatase [bacterium]